MAPWATIEAVGEHRIVLQIDGVLAENGDVDFGKFVGQLKAILDMLVAIDHAAGGSTHFRLVDIARSNPFNATIDLDQKPPRNSRTKSHDRRKEVSRRGVHGFNQLLIGKLPEGESPRVLETMERIAKNVGHGVGRTALTVPGQGIEVVVDEAAGAAITKTLAPTEIVHGSVTGKLLAVDLTSAGPVCRIFPEVGPQEMRCNFAPQDRDAVKAGLDKRVRLHGRKKFRSGARFAHEIDVTGVEVLAEANELPTFADVFGSAPGGTDGKSAEAYVRWLRDG